MLLQSLDFSPINIDSLIDIMEKEYKEDISDIIIESLLEHELSNRIERYTANSVSLLYRDEN